MALSDYAHLQIGNTGKPTHKKFKSFCGIEVDLYKNFVYLEHPEMAKGIINSDWTAPTIAQITNTSDIHIGKLHIRTQKTKNQNGLLVYATSGEYEMVPDGKGGTKYKSYQRRFAGIAVSGYSDMQQEIQKEFILAYPELDLEEKFQNPLFMKEAMFSHSYCGGEESLCVLIPKPGNSKKYDNLEIPMQPHLDSKWVGVTPELVEELKMLAINLEDSDEKWFKKIDWEKQSYVNPGDMFLCNNLGGDTPVSQVGQSTTPMIMSLIDEMSED
jgi:hypothetical protein